MSVTKDNQKAPRILYSCYTHFSREGEQFIPEHVFGYMYAGRLEISIGDHKYVLNAGDHFFFRKNKLARFAKYPLANQEFQSLSVSFDKSTLQSISAEHQLKQTAVYTGDDGLIFKPNALLKNFVSSLQPYIGSSGELNKQISILKAKEAAMILLEVAPQLQQVLFDFSEPGKIDLEAYMNENYRYNVDISRFAYLTGRSLATFKRDFERIFHTSPNRWIQQKRLGDAYFLLKEKGWRTSDVYLEVGFKDFSHFSFAFKKAFGIAPSQLA